MENFVGRANVDKFQARLEEVYGVYIASILHT